MRDRGPSFCILPWVHSFVQQNGDAKLCCISQKDSLVDEGGRPLSLQHHDVASIWNAPALREVRRRMLAGEPVAECRHCTHEESLGLNSPRLYHNRLWLELDPRRAEWAARVEASAAADGAVPEQPASFDLRPGNACNLKCRMCSSTESSAIENDPVHGAWGEPLHFADDARFGPGKAWWQSGELVDEEILAEAERLRHFYFAGGEPLTNPVVKRIVDVLVDRGLAPGIHLRFSTNLTILPERLIERLQAFERVEFNLSVEGTGALYEYVRHPARWSTFDANLRSLLRVPGFVITMTPTVQNYNVLGLTELLDYSDLMGLGHYLNVLYFPARLGVRVLPEAARRCAAERLAGYSRRSVMVMRYPGLRERVDLLLNELAQPPLPDYERQLHEFMVFTNDLDHSRGQSLATAIPELRRFIEESGVTWPDELRHAAAATAPAG